MRKADVTFHREGFAGDSLPAVNVKVRGLFRDVRLPLADAAPGLTHEWIAAHLSDEQMDELFWRVCDNEWVSLQSDAADIFGPGVTVEAEGRSGGWAVVHGLPDVEGWDAVAVAKWARFARYARQCADGVLEQMVYSIDCNEYDWWMAEQAEDAGVHVDVAPMLAGAVV